MKFPSIATLAGELMKTLRRWPLTIALAIAATILLMRASDFSYTIAADRREHLWRMVTGCYLTMLITIAATVFVEVCRSRPIVRVALQMLALGLGLAFYLMLPELVFPRLIRILVLALGLHWLVAVIPYARPKSNPNGFWDYNRKLFLRALQTALYTLTLYVGADLALLAIEHLFGVDVSGSLYENVWWFLSGIFSTVFFLAGFPRIYNRPESIDDYPRGLKVFTQFVLLPIVTLYLTILYAYVFKIIFTAHWPSGWVSWLVLGLAVAGIFALLLIYPLRKDADSLWINAYARFFYLALFPLIVLLWIAIWKRIRPYGITESRYYVLLLGLWLSVMAGYFVFSARKDIRLIPATLCLLALLSLCGPWSAANVSLAAQKGRLRVILEQDGVMVDGKAQRAKAEISLNDRKKISSLIDYLNEMHGYGVLQPWFRYDLDSLMRHNSLVAEDYRQQSTALLDLMGLSYASKYETYATEPPNRKLRCKTTGDEQAIRLESAGFVLPDFRLDAYEAEDPTEEVFLLGQDSMRVRLDSSRHMIVVILRHSRSNLQFDLRPLERILADSGREHGTILLSPSSMTITNASATTFLTNVTATRIDSALLITSASGHIVLEAKP